MWFKNLYVFDLLEPWNVTEDNLNGMLEHNKFQSVRQVNQVLGGFHH